MDAKTRKRGEDQENEDHERTVQNMLAAKFDDWPNEAGFEGLTEVKGPVKLTVKGTIPTWAAGSLYRTGPGEYNIEDTPRGTFRTTHWFDGFGHTHKFDIVPDTTNPEAFMGVEYSSRRQTPVLVEAIRKAGQRPNFSFGQRHDPCIGLFGKIMSVWRMPRPKRSQDLDNIAVVVQANVPGFPSASKLSESGGHRSGIRNVWNFTDANIMKEFDQNTLEPIGFATQQKLNPLLKGSLSCAHAQRDPETGDMFNYNLEFGRFATYRIFRANASTGSTDILATICQADVKAAYIHSFFLTPSFVVFCVPSTHIGWMGLKILWDKNVLESIEPFDKSKLCKWFIIDRKGDRGVVATFDSPAGFFFHSINSFEEADEATGDTDVFCDVIEYPTSDVLQSLEMDVILQNKGMTQNFWGDETRNRNTHCRLVRRKFPVCNPSSRSSTSSKPQTPEKILEIKAPHAGELPTINPQYATKKHRFVYSLPNRGYSSLFDAIVKTDLVTRESLFWDNPRGHTPGEAIFVPRPGKDGETLEEDDGVLLSVILDGVGKTSYLLCLDAKTMQELGRAECEWAVAFGFHGLHAPLV